MPPYSMTSDPNDPGRGPLIMGLTWTFTILAIVAVGMRFYLRSKFVNHIGLDDWLMLVALVFDIACQAIQTVAFHYGLGKHDAALTPDKLMEVLKWMWLTTPGLVVSAVARISIAVLLLKLFGVHKWFKWFVIGISTAFTLLTIAIIPCTYLQVTPISGNWDPFEPSKRWDKHIYIDLAYLGQALWTFTDLAFVLFPVMIIWRLKMSLQRRVGVVLLLSASLITMALSILKTIALGQVQIQQSNPHATDVLYNASLMILYSGLEQNFVIIMGCIPALRAIAKLDIKLSISNSLASLMRVRRPSKSPSFSSLENDVHGGVYGAGGELGGISENAKPTFKAVVMHDEKSVGSEQELGSDQVIRATTETRVLYDEDPTNTSRTNG